MSKTDSTVSTATSRRAVLAGAAGIATLAGLVPAAAGPLMVALPAGDHLALIAEIRRLHAKHQALITYEMSIEVRKGDAGRPAYEAAIAASAAAGDDLEQLCERILDQPVQSWDDVAVRAELAKTYGNDSLIEEPCDLGEKTLGMLLEAALIMAGGAHV